MPHDLLVESVVARKGRTLSLEVRELAREAHMAEPISVPGYLKARQKLEPRALLELARHHAAGVYADGDYATYGCCTRRRGSARSASRSCWSWT
jgi:hypothetical protein